MAHDMTEQAAQVAAHFGPLPTATIKTPIRDTLTGLVREEPLTLYTAVPIAHRELPLDGSVPITSTVKQPLPERERP